MRTIEQARAWRRAQTTYSPRHCLEFNNTAYNDGETSVYGRMGYAMPTAMSLWDIEAGVKHTDGSYPPVGGLMFFSKPGDTDGDVQTLDPGHTTTRTDVGTLGTVGTVDAMWIRDVARFTYLGWREDILGYPLSALTSDATASTGTPVLIGDEDMASSDAILALLKVVATPVVQDHLNMIYKRELGRPVDAAGLASYTPFVLDGGTYDALTLKIRASTEWKRRHPSGKL